MRATAATAVAVMAAAVRATAATAVAVMAAVASVDHLLAPKALVAAMAAAGWATVVVGRATVVAG